jgi:hypothetical protein
MPASRKTATTKATKRQSRAQASAAAKAKAEATQPKNPPQGGREPKRWGLAEATAVAAGTIATAGAMGWL